MDWAYFCWNWKHCSGIIFKCVNSVVGLIFNEKVVEKWNLWDPGKVHLCTVHCWLGQIVQLEPKKKRRKKKKRKHKAKHRREIQPNPNALNVSLSSPKTHVPRILQVWISIYEKYTWIKKMLFYAWFSFIWRADTCI